MKWIVCLVVLLGTVVSGFGEMRIWTSVEGQTIEAEYVRVSMGKVWLKTAAGGVKKIPIEFISEPDREYINLQTPPEIEIEVDDDIDRGTVGTDIDNVREELECTITINKISKKPYPMEYEAQFFLFGYDIESKEYILAEKITKTFALDDSNNNTYSFSGKHQRFEYDPSPAWGNKYDGYLVVVKTKDGKTISTKGHDRYLKNLSRIKAQKEGTRFDKSFKVRDRS